MRLLLILSLFALALAGHSGSANATLVKCQGEHGSVLYQDAPCKPGTELRNFDTDPPTLSVVPFSPAAPATAPASAPSARDRTSQVNRRQPEHKVNPGQAAERRFIRTGMSESEVVRRIGKPEVDASTTRNKHKDGKRWSYLPGPGDPDTITTITIVGGQVADVERKVVH